MGTDNEMVVTVSHPAKVVAEGYMLVGALSSPVGMIRVHRTPRGFCQHQQYAAAWWTDAYESGPVGTEVLAMLNTNENTWRLRRDVPFPAVRFFFMPIVVILYISSVVSVGYVEGISWK